MYISINQADADSRSTFSLIISVIMLGECTVIPAVTNVFYCSGDVEVSLNYIDGREIAIETTSNGDNTFDVSFEPRFPGEVMTRVYFAKIEIPGSPFHITIHPHVNIDAVLIDGLEQGRCVVFLSFRKLCMSMNVLLIAKYACVLHEYV